MTVRQNFRGIDESPLISKPDLAARLASHRRPGKLRFVPDLTITDVSRWVQISYSSIDRYAKGKYHISDRVQIILTQFYTLLDKGLIRLEVHGKHKHFVRVEPGKTPAPPVREPRDPRVEFTPSGPVLKIW